MLGHAKFQLFIPCTYRARKLLVENTRDPTGKDTVKSAFRSERRQVSDMLSSVSKQEAPNFLCWHGFSDLKADSTVSFPVSSLGDVLMSILFRNIQ